MRQDVRNTIVNWKSIRSTLTYQRAPKAAMLEECGYIASVRQGREYYLVKYDRDYLIDFLYNKDGLESLLMT
jgi:hypothetical protein